MPAQKPAPKTTQQNAIHYFIGAQNPTTHYFEVRLTCTIYQEKEQQFALPAWIPGSYKIRDFASHVLNLRAEVSQKIVPLTKIDKHTWQAPILKIGTKITLTYEIYAFERSVRHAHCDATHAFFNGSSVFLQVLTQENAPCLLTLLPSKNAPNWRVATALPRVKKGGKTEDFGEEDFGSNGFGLYRAANYTELIDCPVQMGLFEFFSFKVGKIKHEVAFSGLLADAKKLDFKRMQEDMKRICTTQIDFFGGVKSAPIENYVFLITVTQDNFGGLEHKNSTALICARDQLPYKTGTNEDKYVEFLGLVSHEYFHTWNVKRLKPREFVNLDLARENYTQLLWFFEGFTAYYDDFLLLKAGLINAKTWLKLLEKTITNVYKNPGNKVQSLADSSFDAWIKLYCPNENSPNVTVNYYQKGALLALFLDLTLRIKSQGKSSLDALMQSLWREFGSSFYGEKKGVCEADICKLASQLSGDKMHSFFTDFVHGVKEMPLAKSLAQMGVLLTFKQADDKINVFLGIETKGESELKVSTVYRHSAAEKAGLAAGDVLCALNGERVVAHNFKPLLARLSAKETVEIHVFRDSQLQRFTVLLEDAQKTIAQLEITAEKNKLRQSWLGK